MFMLVWQHNVKNLIIINGTSWHSWSNLGSSQEQSARPRLFSATSSDAEFYSSLCDAASADPLPCSQLEPTVWTKDATVQLQYILNSYY